MVKVRQRVGGSMAISDQGISRFFAMTSGARPNLDGLARILWTVPSSTARPPLTGSQGVYSARGSGSPTTHQSAAIFSIAELTANTSSYPLRSSGPIRARLGPGQTMAATLARETDVPVKVTLRSDGAVKFLPEEPAASPEAAPQPRKIKALVYTGSAVSRMYGDLIIDLATLEVPSRSLPILYNHEDPIGFATFSVGSDGVTASGQLLSGTEDGDMVASFADQGYPWEMSITADLEASLLGEGLTADVNGRTVEGPIWITTSARLREASFVAVGADAETSAEVLSRSPTMFRKSRPATDKDTNMSKTETEPTSTDNQQDISARIAELRAVKGADGDDVLLAMEKDWSPTELKAHLADKFAARIEAQDVQVKAAQAEAADLRRKLELKNETAGAAPVADSGSDHQSAPSAKLSGDPARDWENIPELRDAWKDNGGKRAWLRWTELEKGAGNDYRKEAFCV